MIYGFFLPERSRPYSDEIQYRILANNLYEGNGYSTSTQPPYKPTASRVPGYPLFIAAVFKVAGPSLIGIRVAQIGLYLIVVWLTVLTASYTGGMWVGWLAGILLNLYPFVGYFTSLLLSEMLSTTLFLGVIYVCLRAAKDMRWRWFVLAGFLGGICTLVRPQFLPLTGFLMLGVMVIRGMSAELIKRALLAVFLSFWLIVPWGIRNWLTFHEFIPLDTVGPTVLYMGTMAMRGYDSLNWNKNPKFDQALVKEGNYRKIYAISIKEIRADPIGFLQAAAWRIPRMWIIVYHPGASAVAIALVQTYLLAVYALALCGLWTLRAVWRRSAVLLSGIIFFPLTLFPFWVEARYTTAARPLVLVLASVALLFLWDRYGPRMRAQNLQQLRSTNFTT